MKNIHLLPTDKPSRLYLHSNNELQLRTNIIRTSEEYLGTNQNIYITSDEKFVRDEYVTDGIEVIKATPKLVNAQGLVSRRNWRKIILTTDPDLIKDGVQAIPDEFLEWFVKNPSCEFVEVEKESHIEIEEVSYEGDFQNVEYISYKIITPQEETKQETTLEEVADKANGYGVYGKGLPKYCAFNEGFIEGAKLAERMYSEEEVYDLIVEWGAYQKGLPRINEDEIPNGFMSFNQWFEQFKKK